MKMYNKQFEVKDRMSHSKASKVRYLVQSVCIFGDIFCGSQTCSGVLFHEYEYKKIVHMYEYYASEAS